MLEIIAVIVLCNVNAKNARKRGAGSVKYVLLTLALWFGLEIVGGFIGGLAQLGMGAYLTALIGGCVGGFISYQIAKGGGNVNLPAGSAAPAATQACSFCKNQVASHAKYCPKCGKALASAAQPVVSGAKNPSTTATYTQLRAAARTVFNNPYSDMVLDPDDKLWKEPIQQELDQLVAGGEDSLAILEEFLMQCAAGRGGSISDSWWYGSKWAVKTAGMLPRKAAGALMLRLLQKDSQVMEWFTYVQTEAANQLETLGDPEILPDLQRLLDQPLSMTPVNAIVTVMEKIGGSVAQTPTVILNKAQNSLGDQDGLDFLLPFMAESATWEAKDTAFYYYLLANKAQRLGYGPAARAFYAAQIAARPDSTTFGWQEFIKDGFSVSPATAAELHAKYPVPKSMAEIESYVLPTDVTNTTVKAESGTDKAAAKAPADMSAVELIDFMTTDAALAIGLGVLGMQLSEKLKAGFSDRPQDIEKALSIFGDESMVARFNMIKDTMQPDDLDLLLPDLLTQYINRRS